MYRTEVWDGEDRVQREVFRALERELQSMPRMQWAVGEEWAEVRPVGTMEKGAGDGLWQREREEDRGLAGAVPARRVRAALYGNLFPHQKEGVLWILEKFNQPAGVGGILGDDMGLGKTIQVCAAIALLMGLGLPRRRGHGQSQAVPTVDKVLIVTPAGVVVQNWCAEMERVAQWCGAEIGEDLRIVSTGRMGVDQRTAELESLAATDPEEHQLPTVMVSSYQTVRSSEAAFAAVEWDYHVLDEGHKIKNPDAAQSKAMHKIKCNHRLLLSGTPIMNDLRELWALMDWAANGKVLGNKDYFRRRWQDVIVAGREPNATASAKNAGQRKTQNLQERIAPFFLRRLKEDIGQLIEASKTEIALWVPMTELFHRKYEQFLQCRAFKQFLALDSDRNRDRDAQSGSGADCMLAQIVKLRLLSMHPRLAAPSSTTTPMATTTTTTDGDGDSSPAPMSLFSPHAEDAHRFRRRPRRKDDAVTRLERAQGHPLHVERDILDESPKLQALQLLLRELVGDGHRVLVFSQFTQSLDLADEALHSLPSVRTARIDGTVDKKVRAHIIDNFNAAFPATSTDIPVNVLLLTTGACGEGITLNAADRVVLLDPAWNPAQDAQAADRAYRIGQHRDVVVYRLILSGSIEETVYMKQVLKDGVRVTVMEDATLSARYFTREEQRRVFKIRPRDSHEAVDRLRRVHGSALDVPLKGETAVADAAVLQSLLRTGHISAATQHHIICKSSRQRQVVTDDGDVVPLLAEDLLDLDRGDPDSEDEDEEFDLNMDGRKIERNKKIGIDDEDAEDVVLVDDGEDEFELADDDSDDHTEDDDDEEEEEDNEDSDCASCYSTNSFIVSDSATLELEVEGSDISVDELADRLGEVAIESPPRVPPSAKAKARVIVDETDTEADDDDEDSATAEESVVELSDGDASDDSDHDHGKTDADADVDALADRVLVDLTLECDSDPDSDSDPNPSAGGGSESANKLPAPPSPGVVAPIHIPKKSKNPQTHPPPVDEEGPRPRVDTSTGTTMSTSVAAPPIRIPKKSKQQREEERRKHREHELSKQGDRENVCNNDSTQRSRMVSDVDRAKHDLLVIRAVDLLGVRDRFSAPVPDMVAQKALGATLPTRSAGLCAEEEALACLLKANQIREGNSIVQQLIGLAAVRLGWAPPTST